MASIIKFRGRKYRWSGKYYKAEAWRTGPSSLHRAVWECYRGAIPEGFDIHHIDGDGANNRIANLMLVERREHTRQHTLERYAKGEIKPFGDLARQRAAEWHASPEGRAWHSKNGKAAWKNRVWYPLECQECGRPFKSPYPNKTKFCHLNCKMAAFRRRHRR